MLTLSVRTARGPTSIRIQYSSAQFLLDSSSPARPSLSSFPSVPSLVQHYMTPERKKDEEKVEEEVPSKLSQRTIQETSVVLKLTRAVYKPQGLPSLQHLTRLVINRHSDCPDQLPLPRPLLRYIQDYPFKVWGVLQVHYTGRITAALKEKQTIYRSLVLVNDTAVPAAGGQSQKETRHRVMFSLMKYVQIQSLPTCLVSDVICRGLGWEAPQEKDDLWTNLSTVIYTYFINGCGCRPCLFYPHPLCIYLFSRRTQIWLKHHLSCFISQQDIFSTFYKRTFFY